MLSQQMARARMSDRRDRAARATLNRQLLAARQPEKMPHGRTWRQRGSSDRAASPKAVQA
jgi:hypothetical protein